MGSQGRRRGRRTRSDDGGSSRGADPGFPGFEHNQWTFEGEIERLGAFSRGAARARGWKRAVVIVLVGAMVVPVVIGLIGLADRDDDLPEAEVLTPLGAYCLYASSVIDGPAAAGQAPPDLDGFEPMVHQAAELAPTTSRSDWQVLEAAVREGRAVAPEVWSRLGREVAEECAFLRR